jgi:hypothetical protein
MATKTTTPTPTPGQQPDTELQAAIEREQKEAAEFFEKRRARNSKK